MGATGGEGTGEARGRLLGNFINRLAPALPWWPPLLEFWAGCSSPGHRLPDSLPLPGAKPAGAHGAEGIQRSLVRYRCVHSRPDSHLPANFRAVCPKALCKIKLPCFLRLPTPSFPQAFLVRITAPNGSLPLLWPGGNGSEK